MLYILYGTDKKESREKLHSLVDALLKKKQDASLSFIHAESFNEKLLESVVYGQGLFEAKQIVVFDNVFENADAKEILVRERKSLKESPNIFFLLEGELDKATTDKLERVAERALLFGERLVRGKKEERFNTFSLADALGSKEKKKLWVLYTKARRANVPVEEIHGVFFWQIKSLVLASGAGNAKDAGLNPFVYKKARTFLSHFKEGEAHTILRQLVTLSHEARRGKHEFETALEHFVLTV